MDVSEKLVPLCAAVVRDAAAAYVKALRKADEARASAERRWLLSPWGQMWSFGQGEAVIKNCERLVKNERRLKSPHIVRTPPSEKKVLTKRPLRRWRARLTDAERLKIVEMNSEGYSYREIEEALNITKSTVCHWVNDEDNIRRFKEKVGN